MDPKRKADIAKKFGKRLSELRKKQNLSFRELAAQCDIDHSDIKKYEEGLVNPTLPMIVDLASGLGVHPKELLNTDF